MLETVVNLSYPIWLLIASGFYLGSSLLMSLLNRMVYKHHAISGEKRRPYSISLGENIKFNAMNLLQIAGFIFAAFFLVRHGYSFMYQTLPQETLGWIRFILEVIVILFITDTNFYWVHRLIHENPRWYRKFHIDHHVARYPDVWVTLYQHPLEQLLTTTLPNAMIFFLPVSTWSFLVAMLIKHFSDIAGHSGHEFTGKMASLSSLNGPIHWLDPRRRWIARLVTGITHHDLHHQKVKGNYALYFTFWDRWGQTLIPATDDVFRDASRGTRPRSLKSRAAADH